jgi:hypothetical protein
MLTRTPLQTDSTLRPLDLDKARTVAELMERLSIYPSVLLAYENAPMVPAEGYRVDPEVLEVRVERGLLMVSGGDNHLNDFGSAFGVGFEITECRYGVSPDQTVVTLDRPRPRRPGSRNLYEFTFLIGREPLIEDGEHHPFTHQAGELLARRLRLMAALASSIRIGSIWGQGQLPVTTNLYLGEPPVFTMSGDHLEIYARIDDGSDRGRWPFGVTRGASYSVRPDQVTLKWEDRLLIVNFNI